MQEKDTPPKVESKRSFIEAARRAQIIDCATEAIAELGYAGASLAQIAKRAGVSTGVILYYFRSKEELVQEVQLNAVTFFDKFVSDRLDRTSPMKALHSLINAAVAVSTIDQNKRMAVYNIFVAGLSDCNAPKFDPAVTEPRRAQIVALLEWGQQTGEFRPFDVPSMVLGITGILDLIPWQVRARPDIDLDLYAKELAELFERALRNDK